MSLPDYYQILQVKSTATAAEIKAAFRRLAKLYHPDKTSGNTAAEEKFKQVKEAYDTLINPVRRRKYDEKRSRAHVKPANVQKKTPGKKNYNFSEEEEKRRKYYQQHYKTTSYKAPPTPKTKPKNAYGELRYILISVPVAVALLLLIIRLYEKPKSKAAEAKKTYTTQNARKMQTGESPFEHALGKNIFASTTSTLIKVINNSGYDALIFLQDQNEKIVRHHFVAEQYQLLLERIPQGTYRLYYWLGRGFNAKAPLFTNVEGNFSETICIDSLPPEAVIEQNSNDTLQYSLQVKKFLPADSSLLKKIFLER